MKVLFVNIWKYLALVFAGIIAGMIAAIKLIEKPSIMNVTADSFIAEQTKKIGKLKKKGEGNSQNSTQLREIPSRKEKRMIRRFGRKELRLKKETEMEEQDQNDY
jgi:hypothetical protein